MDLWQLGATAFWAFTGQYYRPEMQVEISSPQPLGGILEYFGDFLSFFEGFEAIRGSKRWFPAS